MNPGRMTRALVRLYPSTWRDRYEAEYLALLEDTGTSPRVALNVVGGAAREWARRSRLLTDRPLRAESALGLFVLCFCALYGFLGGWSDIYKQTTFDMEWRAVQYCDLAFAIAGLILARRGRPLLGYPTVVTAVVAFLWQMGTGPLPGWTVSVVPFQFVLVWYCVVVAVLGWLVLRLPGGKRGRPTEGIRHNPGPAA